MKFFWLALLLPLILYVKGTHQYDPPPPLDRAAFDILHGMGDKDPFDSLRQHEKESYLSDIETSRDLADMVASLIKFEDKTLVQIKLVGLDEIKTTDLTPYLDALDASDPLHSLEGTAGTNKIVFERKILFEVKHAPSALATSITSAIKKHIDTGATRIPYKVVDDIIREDYNSSSSLSHVIYVIDPAIQKKEYGYTQYDSVDAPPRSCLSVSWSGQERYMWLDLRAGPVSYGPQLVGEGFVDEETLPYAKKYDSITAGQVKVDLAAFVQRTRQYLLAPSLTRFPVPWTTLNVHLVMIHDHKVGGHEDSELFSWKEIQTQLQSMPNLNGQGVNFIKSEKSLLDDFTCAQIKTASVKSYASQQKSTNKPKIGNYLDSKELHRWFNIYRSSLIGESKEGELTIPIFLFDISYHNDILLLDRVHQAVSFPDMVIAIQTQHAVISSDFSCNGNVVHIDPRDATRPILASLLQSIWGIAPTHQTWNHRHKRIESNYLWSLSLTPFAPFSIHSHLSFAHGDAGARHLLYAHLQNILSPLADKLEHFLEYGWEIGDILGEDEYLDFIYRWNFLHFKLYQTKKYLTLNLYNASLAFVASSKYDVISLSDQLMVAHERVHSYLNCGEVDVDYVSIASIFLTIILFFGAAIVMSRRLTKKWRRSAKAKSS